MNKYLSQIGIQSQLQSIPPKVATEAKKAGNVVNDLIPVTKKNGFVVEQDGRVQQTGTELVDGLFKDENGKKVKYLLVLNDHGQPGHFEYISNPKFLDECRKNGMNILIQESPQEIVNKQIELVEKKRELDKQDKIIREQYDQDSPEFKEWNTAKTQAEEAMEEAFCIENIPKSEKLLRKRHSDAIFNLVSGCMNLGIRQGGFNNQFINEDITNFIDKNSRGETPTREETFKNLANMFIRLSEPNEKKLAEEAKTKTGSGVALISIGFLHGSNWKEHQKGFEAFPREGRDVDDYLGAQTVFIIDTWQNFQKFAKDSLNKVYTDLPDYIIVAEDGFGHEIAFDMKKMISSGKIPEKPIVFSVPIIEMPRDKLHPSNVRQ